MTKLWGGRYSKGTDELVNKFTSSINYDYRLAKFDVLGSIAHIKMLRQSKIVKSTAANKILTGLKSILAEIEKGTFKFDESFEDIHSNIQHILEKKVGSAAKSLHTARSRNDQVSIDTRMYCREEIKNIKLKIKKFQKSLLSLAEKNINLVIPGYTHLQHAQPVLVAQHLLAYCSMLERDIKRLDNVYKQTDVLVLGACALAGTTLPTNRKYVAKLLGFSGVSENSMDSVADRDFIIDFLSALSVIAMHFSRLCEDFILWNCEEFGFIDIDEKFCTGSSMMPQKKNPDILELVRGSTGKIYASLINVLVVMKGLPLTYNRDMQFDKQPLFESIDLTNDVLDILYRMFTAGVKFNKTKINKGLQDEFLYATDIAEYLVKKGVSFKDAHNAVGRLVKHCIDNKIFISEVPLKKLKSFSKKFDKKVYKLLDKKVSVNSKLSYGGTSLKSVKKQMSKITS